MGADTVRVAALAACGRERGGLPAVAVADVRTGDGRSLPCRFCAVAAGALLLWRGP